MVPKKTSFKNLGKLQYSSSYNKFNFFCYFFSNNIFFLMLDCFFLFQKQLYYVYYLEILKQYKNVKKNLRKDLCIIMAPVILFVNPM